MRQPLRQLRRSDGAIILFALIVLLVGTIVLASWVQILSSRAAYSDTAFQAQQRRVAQANGRALARQFVLEQMPSGAILGATNSGSISGNWGSFLFSSPYTGFWTESTITAGNPFNAMGRFSFNTLVYASVTGGGATQTVTFHVRGRNPVLAGYPLVIQNASPPGSVGWAPTNMLGTNMSGYASTPRIRIASTTNAADAYLGRMNGPVIMTMSGQQVFHTGYTNATPTSIELIVNPTETNAIITFMATNTSIISTSGNRITNNSGTVYTNNTHAVSAVRIVGSSSATNVLQVIIPSGNTVMTNLVLAGSNTRPVYAIRQAAGTTLGLSTASSVNPWRLTMTLLNSPLTVAAPGGGLLLRGGIRTDTSVTVSANTLTNIAESAGIPDSGLEIVSDRVLWLEDYR